MEGGKVNVSPCVNQTCHQPVIYLLIYPHTHVELPEGN
jgi:hypothetical protein